MIQLAVQANNGQPGARRYLDLYDTDPIKLNLSIEDITTTDTTAVYSQTFRIPATGNNSAFFVSMFDVNGFDFDISQRQPAEIIIDSDIYQSGEIRLLKVYVDELGNSVDYECLFLGTTRDFASAIGEASFCQMDMSDLGHTFNIANITSSWDAYPETPATDPNYLTAGLQNGNIVYPLIDFGNTYDDNLDVQETRIGLGSGIHFTQPTQPLDIDRMRPCIRAKYLWDRIFESAGYTYESNFLNSNLFQHLYIGVFGDAAAITLTGESSAGVTTTEEINNSAIEKININSTSNAGTSFNLGNNEYVCATTDTYDIVFRISGESLFEVEGGISAGDATHRFRLVKDSGGVLTTIMQFDNISTTAGQNYGDENFLFTNFLVTLAGENISAVAGDKFYTTVEEISSQGSYVRTDLLPRTDVYVITEIPSGNPANSFDCDYLQIDFIKDIVSKFRLVMAPDRNVKDKFIIEPWQQYIGTGQQLDWTSKIDLSKDVQISPVLYTQKERITFKDKEGEDYLNVLNQTDIGETYGTLNYDSNSPLLKDTREIKTKLTPIPSTQIAGASEGTNGGDNCIIPQIHDQVAEVTPNGQPRILRNPCKPGIMLMWWDGMKHTGTVSGRDINWYLTDQVTQQNYSKFPMVSEFNEWGDRDDSFTGIDSLTQTLNWQKENTYIRFGLANPGLGSGCFDNYWANYINSLYNPFSRRVTAYLKLDKFDLLNFSFDDAVFLKNAWYYVEKINNLDMTKESSVKVDLIRLNNFKVTSRNFIPPSGLPQLWEDVSDNWEAITTNWENV